MAEIQTNVITNRVITHRVTTIKVTKKIDSDSTDSSAVVVTSTISKETPDLNVEIKLSGMQSKIIGNIFKLPISSYTLRWLKALSDALQETITEIEKYKKGES